MGTINSSKKKTEEQFSSPIHISQEALDNLTLVAADGEEKVKNRLEKNEEMWLNRYTKLEESYECNGKMVDKETFNDLYDSLSDYLRDEETRKGENIKNEVLDCYYQSKNETLNCSAVVRKFHSWLNETRNIITKSKTEILEEQV